MKVLTVVAALIEENNKILICQRKEDDAYGLFWEFPGGGVEPNETFEQAIIREMTEELGVLIRPIRLINCFSDTEGELTINVHLFECQRESGDFSAIECRDFVFVDIKHALKFDLAPVDIKILDYLKGLRENNKKYD